MSKVSSGDGPNSDSPFLNSEFQRQQFDRSPSEDVPDNLRAISFFPSPSPYEHVPIDRTSLDKVSIEPIQPYLPPWVAVSRRPRLATFPGQPKPKIWHRGAELDPLFIWPPDDRRVYCDKRYPWGCVCRIITPILIGSGVIVGPRHVLTASHLLDWNNVGGTVEVNRAGPAVSAISAISRVLAFTKVSGDPGSSEVDEDYALIITADRIGDRFGSFGWRTYNSSWDDEPYWWNIGYSWDILRAMHPHFQKWKSLDEDEWDYGSARAMTTTVDVMKGQSGSPIFGFWQAGPYVVAVVSATGNIFLSGDENWCSGGNLLTRLVRYGRDHYP